MINSYESVFIVDGTLAREGQEQAVSLVKEQVAKLGGQVEKVQELGKRTLAYPVKKKREGTYFLMHFKGEPQAIARLRQAFALAEPILRTLIVKLER